MVAKLDKIWQDNHHIAMSSNGRTPAFEAENLGPIPSVATDFMIYPEPLFSGEVKIIKSCRREAKRRIFIEEIKYHYHNHMENIKKKREYAFDFDGVISAYEGFKGIHHTGVPNNEVVKAIRLLKADGHTIIIHSTKGEEILRKYCAEHDIPVDYFNRNPEREGENCGKPIAYAYIDDRAICYRGQSAEQLVEEITNFKAYWQK